MEELKSVIGWVSCKDELPKDMDDYLVLIKTKYYGDEDYSYYVDMATSMGSYIDNFWDTQQDWDEGQYLHITHWAKLPKVQEKNKVEEKYIRKLRKIKKQHGRYYDNEVIHGQYDEILLELLKELGYEKIVKMYEKESENFWYA